MAGEYIDKVGESGWMEVGAGLLLKVGEYKQASADNTISSLMAATEKAYPLFDAKLKITVGTSATNITVDLILRPQADGESPAPTSTYEPHNLGSFILDTQTGDYYLFERKVKDNTGTFYLKSQDPNNTLTATLSIRMKTGTAAA